MWLHVDGSWGGAVCFSARHAHRLDGCALADSVTLTPHKMLGVPMTCSFLLTGDLRAFRAANALRAGYLFHGPESPDDVWDLADLTMQCGRRGDALKLALSWVYYGARGFERAVDHAFDMALRLTALVRADPCFELVSPDPPPCLQVCFYYAPGRRAAAAAAPDENTARTRAMVQRLVARGFMVDFAPGPRGSMFRVVVNCQTLCGTVDGLFAALQDVGREVCGADDTELSPRTG
ncbi:Pyridoxal phosphate-dependent decarboxylase [Metarhizium album ARSEF 1941]|uniref:Pyridoxal phosphate-dependent decarboxylase n=1 Tax=Metarhizium album (strain ARSEF 1941) TaxID=1081103 RepID=A0A0B2X3B4_METAS|nr:Pyridoxal phosphate-dependent decarboxylase [Metarhizium album ARSEF 1941]KHN99780.1 Pyridoxal phosphate-dependent decarboxylase [Metarhizium album ARSEF 1941]